MWHPSTRTKAESKKTWAPSGEDWFNHLGPGILAVIGFLCLLTFNIVAFVKMNEWMAGTLFEDEPATATQKAKYYARLNDACVMFIIAASILPIIKLARFAVDRLIIHNQPEEKVKT